MKPTTLIAGATGATGSAATKLLLERGFPVRALVHRGDERSRKLESQGAEVVVGDLLDAVRRAFNGAKRGHFICPMRPRLTQASAQFAQAAVEAKAEFVVNMSQQTSREDAGRFRAPALAIRTGVRSGRDTGCVSAADGLQRVGSLNA
jgi:NAD(P)H dehydrogenase (quinone)